MAKADTIACRPAGKPGKPYSKFHPVAHRQWHQQFMLLPSTFFLLPVTLYGVNFS
ncbi:hypothetical protein DBT_1871 [Dissulfuribacter thermophilus]|uniref:Uncharacterized protein n=1 Tax=Dissulfuribacter thermophilus TaxID=1156395 RepID=A0A1B9F4Y8_9BACT|nr:hypothetical protein DBT_1871 [Dissulfuribacter thermophilus]